MAIEPKCRWIFFPAVFIFALAVVFPVKGRCGDNEWPPAPTRLNLSPGLTTPLDMDLLEKRLGYARGDRKGPGKWPRVVQYRFAFHDYRDDLFQEETRAVTIEKKPERIIPHSVGVAEILWAICPRERIAAFNEFAAEPHFSFIGEEVRQSHEIFQSRHTERVIGLRPDLVFTVFYSGAEFKEKLAQAGIPYLDLGYFGTLESVKEQIVLVGEVIGEEENARVLIERMDENIRELQAKIPRTEKPVTAVFYNLGGYVAGKRTNFTAICDMIGVKNLAAEKGVSSMKQIDHETLLEWDPDVIVVPKQSRLKGLVMQNPLLAHAKAVREKKVFETPDVYLNADSQFMVSSANLMAGMIFGD